MAGGAGHGGHGPSCSGCRDGVSAGVAIALGSAALPAWADGSVATEDEKVRRMAIELAAKADFPFGAVIIHNGDVLAKGRNHGKTGQDPTAHGEIVAIRNVLRDYPPEALTGTTFYTSGEPCVMCIGAILRSGRERAVFAASLAQLATRIGQILIPSQTVADSAALPH